MKVLIINSVCEGGSTGKIVKELRNAIMKQGNECKIAYGLGKKKKETDYIKFNNKIGYNIHNLLSKLFDRTGEFSYLQTRFLIKKIKEYNPDIIHLHHVHGYYINYKLLFKYFGKANIPVVWTFHDCWPITGHCTYFSNIECYKWKSECEKCPLLNQYPKSYFIDNSKKNYNNKKKYFTIPKNMTIVTPSVWLSKNVKDSFLNKYNIKVINNGIDLSIFKPTKCDNVVINKIKKKIILGVANVWNKEKGYDDFIELSKMVSDDYQIVMIGLTDNQIKNLPPNIIGIHRTSNQQELASIYSSSFVFLNLTYQDNYPTVNLEAQACGLPIITYDTDGSPEAVFTDYGFVVKKGDIQAVYNKIKEINYKKNDIVNASKIFDYNLCYEKYINLYNIILNK